MVSIMSYKTLPNLWKRRDGKLRSLTLNVTTVRLQINLILHGLYFYVRVTEVLL